MRNLKWPIVLFIALLACSPSPALAQSRDDIGGISIIALIVILVVFLITRELQCWYWKINEQNELLRNVLRELQGLRTELPRVSAGPHAITTRTTESRATGAETIEIPPAVQRLVEEHGLNDKALRYITNMLNSDLDDGRMAEAFNNWGYARNDGRRWEVRDIKELREQL